MILSKFITEYNAFVKAVNNDCGEEVFVSLKKRKITSKNIFEELYERNHKTEDFALHFFVPYFAEKDGVGIIGYNPLEELFFCQSSDDVIYTSVKDSKPVYNCAPSSSKFIELLTIGINLEQETLKDDFDEKIRIQAFEEAFELVGADDKYKHFCKLVAGV